MNEEIKTKLNSIFADVFKDKSIRIFNDMTTNDVERWDSLSHLTLIATIENEFNIKFKLKELIAMKNVGDLINGIQTKSEI
jgi:acyl carrier protein